jgi:TrmH family RNA methyltransferase
MTTMRRISSRQNPIVSRFRELARGRGSDGTILLDGEHLVQEALGSGITLDTVAFAERVVDRMAEGLVARVERAGAHTVRVPEQVLAAISPVRQPSGIVAIARAPMATLEHVLASSPQLLLVRAGVQDAGNVGAIVRAADGCGATGLITTESTADPFGWKALRGAMGSTFRLPIAVNQPLASTIERLDRLHIPLLAAVPRDGTPMPECDLTGPIAVMLGGEGAGLPDDIAARASARVTIPMRPPVESLNVAITGALILYEASRQRQQRAASPVAVR